MRVQVQDECETRDFPPHLLAVLVLTIGCAYHQVNAAMVVRGDCVACDGRRRARSTRVFTVDWLRARALHGPSSSSSSRRLTCSLRRRGDHLNRAFGPLFDICEVQVARSLVGQPPDVQSVFVFNLLLLHAFHQLPELLLRPLHRVRAAYTAESRER